MVLLVCVCVCASLLRRCRRGTTDLQEEEDYNPDLQEDSTIGNSSQVQFKEKEEHTKLFIIECIIFIFFIL